jgi:hypothetical protein
VAVQEVEGRHLLLDEFIDRFAVADYATITFELFPPLLDCAEGKAQTAQAAFGPVHLSSGTGHPRAADAAFGIASAEFVRCGIDQVTP